MLKKLALASVLSGVAMAGVSGANAATLTYGWEDGVGTVLGTFNNDGMQYTNTTALAYGGSHALLVEDLSATNGGTPQAYVGWVNGLTDGDTVTASFWVYDSSEGVSPSARIWGHYTDDASDVDSYAGSAGGNSTYSAGTGWSLLEHTWTFDSAGGDRDGLMIEFRFYDGADAAATGALLVDDLTITSSAGSIASPVPVPAAAWLFGTGLLGLFGYSRRNKAKA